MRPSTKISLKKRKTMNTCPVCGLKDDQIKTEDRGERINCSCTRCGDFSITRTATTMLNKGKQDRAKISAWIRDKKESRVEPPEINSYNLNQIKDFFRDFTVTEKQLLILKWIAGKSEFPGQEIEVIADLDYPVVWASGKDEYTYLFKAVRERKLVKQQESGRYVVTSKGWNLIDQLEMDSGNTSQVFVAMSFNDNLKGVWKNAIKPAIENAGYKPYRVDMLPHIDRIDAKIITEINNSCFIVADVTEQKNGVYFEAGYAMGKKLPVIWSVREDDLENAHFDTRQFCHITWKSCEDLQEQLFDVICSVIGRKKN